MTPKEQAQALAACGGCGAGGVREARFGSRHPALSGATLHRAYCPTCHRSGDAKLTCPPTSIIWSSDKWCGLVTEARNLMYVQRDYQLPATLTNP